jgi:hydrogenase-1 operon protein HyaF
MTRLSDIPVKVEFNKQKEGNHAIARKVLSEVKAALAEWLATGKAGAIDLKNVPRMGAETYQFLKDVLSTGEVTIVIEAKARVDIRETQYPGVWWVTHTNDRGDIVTEIIEITAIPAILKPHIAEVRHGLQRLEQVLSEPGSESASVSLN